MKLIILVLFIFSFTLFGENQNLFCDSQTQELSVVVDLKTSLNAKVFKNAEEVRFGDLDCLKRHHEYHCYSRDVRDAGFHLKLEFILQKWQATISELWFGGERNPLDLSCQSID